ncbi:hypothetical protein LWM68_31120 [Niabella sp. W65]|nr:hypothetical protein [Niabella sp. W65]MCH7366826.1 hypothetical protein [Niabella sp. W65]
MHLCDALDENLEKLHHQPDTIFIDELDTHTIKAMLKEIDLPEIRRGIFLHKSLDELKKQFLRSLKCT